MKSRSRWIARTRQARATVVTLLAIMLAVLAAPILPVHGQTTPAAPAGQPPTPPAATPGRPTAPAAPASIYTASYEIEARWDAVNKQIQGTATITYRNNSPDTLGELWMKLYLNAFRDENTLWMRESSGAHRDSSYDPKQPGWITLNRLRLADTGEDLLAVTGSPTDTVLQIPLPAARRVPPGESIRLDVAWTSQLPRVFARTGVAGDFVMAGQWYPKLAVYDRGAWDTEPWHANAEFYADFGTYTLTLTVPMNYITGATGSRQGTVTNNDGTTTVRYFAESVSDIAWTAWPGYRLVTRAVEAAGRPVELELLAPRSMSTETDQRFLDTAQRSLDLLGRWFGQYPWSKLTLVVPPADASGAGGMEYPMLATLALPIPGPFGVERGLRGVEIVTVHEIAHQWVPLQLATNEAREAWLDEGFADYATTRVLATIYPPDRSMLDVGPFHLGYETLQRIQYLMGAVTQPLALPSWEYPDFLTYGATVYSKGTLTFLTLERTYGEERFLPAMQRYFDRWRWRHPTTADLQRSLEADLQTSLEWFFAPLVFGSGTVEYAVPTVSFNGTTVARRGDVAFPVDVELTDAPGRVTRGRWEASRPELEISASDGLQRVRVDPDWTISLEANRLDNGRDVDPAPTPMLTLAARVLGLIQAALLAGMLG